MISDGRGQVAVAASAGTVKLVSAGASVDVTPGQVARVDGEAAPSAPTTIPTSLFLKVAAPARVIQRERETVVQGTATPGALVNEAPPLLGPTLDLSARFSDDAIQARFVVAAHDCTTMGRRLESSSGPRSMQWPLA